jgi:hypothetical protein
MYAPGRKKVSRLSKQNALCKALVASVAALTIPVMPAMAQMKTPAKAPAPAPVAEPAPASSEAPEILPAAAEVAAPLLEPASGSFIAAPASPSLIVAPTASASTPVAGPGFSLPSVKLPFSLSLSYRPETAAMGGTGFAPGVATAPTQFDFPAANGAGWSGTAEIGLPFITLGGRTTSYGSIGNFDASSVAAGLPYYWPEGAWSTYVRAFGLRFGYLNEQFNRNIGKDGAIGSLVGGIDSGFNILGVLGVDYHALAGWGVHGQTVDGTTTNHIPTEAEASVYANIGPVNLRLGYVARASFTGDPSTFLTVLTNPLSLATDEGKRTTVNATRLGTYMGPFFGAGFTF